jgi:hypothetical protein
MGRGLHRHLIARRETRPFEFDKFEPPKTPYWGEAEFLVAVCGEEHRVGSWKNDRFLEEASHITCPQCRTKIAKALLKQRPADAPKLSLEADKDARGGFRNSQGWKALVDGEPVAILGYEEHAWRIYPFAASKKDDGEIKVANTYGVLLKDHSTGSRFDSRGYRLPSSALEFKTKEDALMACEGLRLEGVLKTPTEVLADYHERQAEAKVWNENRRRKLAARDEKNRNTLEALREILGKETLSNFQREGLLNAIELYEAKVNPPAEEPVE